MYVHYEHTVVPQLFQGQSSSPNLTDTKIHERSSPLFKMA